MPYYRLFYHLVWATRERQPLVTEAMRPDIHRAIAAKIEALEGELQAVFAMPDHVHVVATVPPKVAVAAFVGQIKGSVSHLAARLPGVSAFGWQSEYAALTVSERQVPVVVRYVNGQLEHHAANNLNERLERCGSSE